MRLSLKTLALLADMGDIQARDAFQRYLKLRSLKIKGVEITILIGRGDNEFSMGMKLLDNPNLLPT